jgi:hypothetical protein
MHAFGRLADLGELQRLADGVAAVVFEKCVYAARAHVSLATRYFSA